VASGGSILLAGTLGSGVFLSSDNGMTWTPSSAGLPNAEVLCFAVPSTVAGGSMIFAGTSGGGIFLSTDNGVHWTAANAGLAELDVRSLGFIPSGTGGTVLLAGTGGGGVFVSTDNGSFWTSANTGLANTDVRSIAISGHDIVVGTGGGGVWKRSLTDIITSIQIPTSNLPSHFSLDQNYPNPFNPTTAITYRTGNAGKVSLKVFSVIGTEVATLVDETQDAGEHKVGFHATNFPSGVYFYVLRAGGATETRRMVLLK
jgi:hypothetical protein